MSRFFSIALGFLLMFNSATSFSALDLELTRGVIGAIPVAVNLFDGDRKDMTGSQSMTSVIASDLNHSGQFNASQLQLKTPSDISKVDLSKWQSRGVNDVLFGKITALSDKQFQVTIDLLNVFAKAQNASSNPAQPVILSDSFTTNQAGLRQLSHHISDLVYEKLTGVKGIFSTKIAYILVQRTANQPTVYSLEIADQDGFNEQTLLRSYQPVMSPAWSPDGQKLAYVSFENKRAEIYIQDIKTGEREVVSQVPGINGAPAFSPDGARLALVLSKSGSPKIYVMDVNSGALTQITHGYAIDTEPTWSPDGQSILFTSSRGGNPQIYQYSFVNRAVSRLTFDGNYNARPRFLPDASGFVMMHRDKGLFGIGVQYLQNARLSVLTRSGKDESPSVSPNGKMVLYASSYAGRHVLAMVSIDGRVKLRLPAKQGSVQEPAWSPFLSS